MTPDEKSKFIADKARETFLSIRELRKTMPQRTRAQKDELLKKIKELQDKWWEDVRELMTRPNPGSIRVSDEP